MIARDCGTEWQIVFQPDHGDFAGGVARAWAGGPFARGSRHDSLATAARHHDDGWLVWEREPRLSASTGAPLNFFELDPAVHLSFYRACIDAVTEQDPYAGRLIGLHCAGIYRGRYGVEPELKVTLSERAKDVIDEFVAEQEQLTERAIEAGEIDENSFWADYKLLQVFDRLALVPPRTDWAPGQKMIFGQVPLAAGGEGNLEVTIAGRNAIALDPFPFDQPIEVSIVRRLVPKADWGSDARFAEELGAVAPESLAVALNPPTPQVSPAEAPATEQA